LLARPAGTDEELAPRGYAGFQPFAARGGKFWFAGGGGSGNWSGWQQLSLRDGEGKPGRIVACTPGRRATPARDIQRARPVFPCMRWQAAGP
jgi:hypothetical protein